MCLNVSLNLNSIKLDFRNVYFCYVYENRASMYRMKFLELIYEDTNFCVDTRNMKLFLEITVSKCRDEYPFELKKMSIIACFRS